jgi:type I restriction enzyme M protein
MALKKSQLYSSLWSSCDELRGGMDASQYKDYVLTLLFMKYVSDKAAGDPDSLLDVPEGGGFADMEAVVGRKDIGDQINKIIARFAEANDLKGVIDTADFNDESKLGSGKDMQDRLTKLVQIFADLDFSANRADGDDLLGDAYEYLMRHFATESGKSKGQFYTPAEVSRILAKVVGIGSKTRLDQTVYDPTCGSGSLLLKAADEAPKGITVYGQEMDVSTWALARMNMILHGRETADIWRGNTLSSPYFKEGDARLMTFDFAVANPPFSQKNWTSGFDPEHDMYNRFEYGVPPVKNGDFAFLLHILRSLKSTGKAAVILPHGVLFRGNKEAVIRRNLVRQGYIKGIIGLPANLFYGTGIPACILVLDKEQASARTHIFMIDASKGFTKDGNKNRLRHQDLHRIVDTFNREEEIDRYSRKVPIEEIAGEANDYNLNIPRYIDTSEPEDLQDLDAHLRGGIPGRDIDALQSYWEVLPSLREELFKAGDRPGYLAARIDAADVKTTILEHAEYEAYAADAQRRFTEWADADRSMLQGLEPGCQPKEVIHTLSEDLLVRFTGISLLSRYDVYQRLMEYWDEVMQDDLYLIAIAGWYKGAQPRFTMRGKKKGKEADLETPDLKIGRAKYQLDLVPPGLIVTRYFLEQQELINKLQAAQNDAEHKLEEFVEECSGEEDLLEDAKNDAGKVVKGEAKARYTVIKNDPEMAEEAAALKQLLKLMEVEAAAKKKTKTAQEALDKAVLAKYEDLSEDEIKSLVIEDKWYSAIGGLVDGEVRRLSNRLANRIEELRERYDATQAELKSSIEDLAATVDQHMRDMGLVVS